MSEPSTTIVPFSSLPSCAADCGPLYDANGACVPPQVPDVDNSCFCNFGPLSPFHEGASGACDAAGCDNNALSSIQGWYTNYCSSATGEGANAGSSATSSDAGSATGRASVGTNNDGGGGDWISNHWQWVIAIVILVVGIAGIWIGACIWRRRYLRRKERANHFGKHTSASAFPAPGGSTVHVGQPGAGAPPAPGASSGDVAGPPPPGSFMPGTSSAPIDEKPKKEKKRWIVRERT